MSNPMPFPARGHPVRCGIDCGHQTLRYPTLKLADPLTAYLKFFPDCFEVLFIMDWKDPTKQDVAISLV
jgi:hypothetical protein